jgi:hypothetical protein
MMQIAGLLCLALVLITGCATYWRNNSPAYLARDARSRLSARRLRHLGTTRTDSRRPRPRVAPAPDLAL